MSSHSQLARVSHSTNSSSSFASRRASRRTPRSLARVVASSRAASAATIGRRCDAQATSATRAVTNETTPMPMTNAMTRRNAMAMAIALTTTTGRGAEGAEGKGAAKTRAGANGTDRERAFSLAREDVKKLMAEDKDFGPTMVRLAWHSSGTYDRISQTGGSRGGTIRFKEELAHGGNAGLDKAVKRLEPIKKRHPDISWADLIAFVGVVAIEEMGGPKIQFSYGRVDEMDPSAVTPDGRLPDADKGDGPGPKTRQGLRDVFYRMGFDDRDIVALSGAHALGRCHADASGYVGPWTGTPLLFNNSYFVLLKGLKWEPDPNTKKFQYRDPSGNLMMLPSDIALIKDVKFKKYVDMYADRKGGQELFFKDFASAFERLETLGTKNLTPLKG